MFANVHFYLTVGHFWHSPHIRYCSSCTHIVLINNWVNMEIPFTAPSVSGSSNTPLFCLVWPPHDGAVLNVVMFTEHTHLLIVSPGNSSLQHWRCWVCLQIPPKSSSFTQWTCIYFIWKHPKYLIILMARVSIDAFMKC